MGSSGTSTERDRSHEIFVFGSNKAGRHGAGAALAAYRAHGAQYGKGWGPQGRSYAIPTKDYDLRVLPLDEIALHVKDFVEYAKKHPDLIFNVTRIGCGLAGYIDEQIAPMFKGAPDNCKLPPRWRQIMWVFTDQEFQDVGQASG